VLLFFIGLLSGIISGMGIGGGAILIPSMIFLAGTSQHIAQSVNLTAFIPTALVAIYVHWKNKHIRFKLALHLILAGALGAVLGSRLASSMPAYLLRRLFGVFLLLMGVYELIRKEKKRENDNR
jgi:uncharacterized membrane protein YfcA